MAPHFDINLILVGRDVFTADDLQMVDNVVARGKSIYANAGLPIGAVNNFHIKLAKVGALYKPRNEAECAILGERWAVPNDAMDVFVVLAIGEPGMVGVSPINGWCSKRASKEIRTPVISISDGVFVSSLSFAHEIGHCLGLRHCHLEPITCGPNNVMQRDAAPGNFKFTPIQLARMKTHCYVKA